MFGEEELVKSHKRRADLIFNIIWFLFAVILARLWYLQIYKGAAYYQYSLQNRLRKEVVIAPRGMIFSRNNELLVHNTPRFDAVITPQYLTNKRETILKFAKIVEMDSREINSILKKKGSGQARYIPITIKKNISRKEVAIIETENSKMPGISVQTFISREYKDDFVGAHFLGRVTKVFKDEVKDDVSLQNKYIGRAGIEKEFDNEIRGEDGYEFVEVDALGRRKRYVSTDNLFQGIDNKAAIPGNNIRLTIDRDLQLAAYNALEGKVGSAVMVDVNTGEILAMVSRPSYNPSVFNRQLTSDYWNSLVEDENNPLIDRTIQEHYPPGSTFKTFTAIAGLEEGIVDENTEIICPGYIKVGRRKVHCWKEHGHGKVDIIKAIRESCDVFFYKIALKIDIDVLAHYARLFGFNNKTGISLPLENKGLIPTKDWKMKRNGQEWQLGETVSCAIGQSYMLVTPLQLTMAYATIANGGNLYKVHNVKEIFSNDGNIISKSEPSITTKNVVSQKTLEIVKRGLYQVANDRKGTAWWYRGKGIQMAGKTGTSQVIRFTSDKIFSKCEENEYKYRHHGVFAAYAPAENPKVAIGVVVEHGCHGSSAAAPVAAHVIETYLDKYYPNERKKYLEDDKVMMTKFWAAQNAAKKAADAAAAEDQEDE